MSLTDNMPTEEESGLPQFVNQQVIGSPKEVTDRLGKSACNNGLLDPSSVRKAYCPKHKGYCSFAVGCQEREEYKKAQSTKS